MQPLEQKKRQKILLGILIAVAVVTVFIWYSNYQKGPAVEESTSQEESTSATEERLKEMELDFSVLNNNLFKSLKSHGALPVITGETGRENPFEPY